MPIARMPILSGFAGKIPNRPGVLMMNDLLPLMVLRLETSTSTR
jgi:hypothetical protein